MFLETFFVVVVFVVLVAGPFVLGRRLNNTSGDGSPAPKLLAARTPLFDMGAWMGDVVQLFSVSKKEGKGGQKARTRRSEDRAFLDPTSLLFASKILVSVEHKHKHSPHSRCRNHPRPQSPRS